MTVAVPSAELLVRRAKEFCVPTDMWTVEYRIVDGQLGAMESRSSNTPPAESELRRGPGLQVGS